MEPSRLQPDALEAVRALHGIIEREGSFSLPLRLWDSSELGAPAAPFRIVLNYPWSARALLRPPVDLSAGEAYVYGDIDIEGDVVAAMAAGATMGERMKLSAASRLRLLVQIMRLPRPPRRRTDRRAHLHGRMHTRERDREAIRFHYDLPQDFYRCFLDSEFVYSCAYFLDGEESLEDAQRRKLDVICRKLRLRPGMRMLDIGCGWGALLSHAARNYGVHGVGVTLSETQMKVGRQRLAADGVADRVELRLADYRDLDERFDAIASVGMVEHVGPAHLSEYFANVNRLLAEGGLFLSHGIVIGDNPDSVRKGDEKTFVGAYVFPDGGLAPVWRHTYELEHAGFELRDAEQLRPSYALTLRNWVRRLEDNHDAAVAAASEADYRIWRAYIAASAYSFEVGSLGVVQLLGSKRARTPLGRAWMLPVIRVGDRVLQSR